MGERLAKWASAVADRMFGPVFTLDAIRVGRRMSTFVVRWLYLVVLVFLLVAFLDSWRHALDGSRNVVDPAVLARFAEEFFWQYSVTQFLIIATITPALTAACITDEKERKTLHFLLATDLTGREIVFGKLASRVLVLFTLVIAGLPIISIMQLFGGIEPRLLFVSVSMTAATVVSLSALSVAASVLMARTRDAMILAYVLPVAYLLVSVVAQAVAEATRDPQWQAAVAVFAAGDPFTAKHAMDQPTPGNGPLDVALRYLAFHALATVLGLAVATWRLNISLLREGPAEAPRTRAGRVLAKEIKLGKARRHPPLVNDPMYWREVHVEPGSGRGVRTRLLAALTVIVIFLPFIVLAGGILADATGYGYGWHESSGRRFREATQIWVSVVTVLLGILMMLRATIRGAYSLAGERDRDTWVSLITTPLTVREILRGKWAGCVWGQKGEMVVLGIVWAIGVLTFSVNPVALLFVAVALWAYLNAFAWLGISCSATAPTSRAAIGRAMPFAVFWIGGYWVVVHLVLGIERGPRGVDSTITFIAGMTPAAVLALVPSIDVTFLGRRSWFGGFIAFSAGWGAGVLLWWYLAAVWEEKSRRLLAAASNREYELLRFHERRELEFQSEPERHNSE